MKYKAFISYSNHEDKNFAQVLQNSIEIFAKKWYQIRNIRIFRDETNLKLSASLWQSIEKALQNAEYFIYLASPRSAQSKWVQQEIQWWLKNREKERLLIILTDGNIQWDNSSQDFDSEQSNAIAPNLFGIFSGEPLYLNLIWAKNPKINISHDNPRLQSEIATLASVLLEKDKDELIGYNVSQIKIRKRFLQFTSAFFILLTIALMIVSYTAYEQRNLAIRQKDKAEEARTEAESLVYFMTNDLDKELRSIGRLDLMENVQKEISAYYSQLGTEEGKPNIVSQLNINELHLAYTNARQGHMGEAEEDFEMKVQVFEELLKRSPDDFDLQMSVVTRHYLKNTNY